MIRKPITADLERSVLLDRYEGKIRHYALNWLCRIERWRRNAKTRKQLAALSPYLYQDIGLTDRQVGDEVKKKFWQ